jgi:hypothetical protein
MIEKEVVIRRKRHVWTYTTRSIPSVTIPITTPAISIRIPVMPDPALGDWVAEAAPEEALLAAFPEVEDDPAEEAVALADPLMEELEPDEGEEEPPPSPASEYPIFVQLALEATW